MNPAEPTTPVTSSGGLATNALAGRVAIVTGAGALDDGIGNGRAAALVLARAGARVVAVDLNPARAARTREMIEAQGGAAVAVAADVTTGDGCKAVVDMAVKTWGRLDILDNNVGIGSRGDVVATDYEAWQRVMRVNVDSMFLMAKHAIPAMTAGGAIINVSSISAIRPRGLTAYSTSKGAVIALTRAMAVDHGKQNIRVNAVLPGPVYTPMVYAAGMSEEARALRQRASVLPREGTGWDVGNAVAFLASDLAAWITGQCLVVDGGVTLRGPDRDP